MKVLLSHGYFIHEDEAEKRIMMPYPPQGLLHLATYLRVQGLECEVFDTTFSSIDVLFSEIESKAPAILGLYVNLMTRPNILKIISFVKRTRNLEGTKIILGGPDVRHHASRYLDSGADFCIVGEGEMTLLNLVRAIEQGMRKELMTIKGLYYINDDGLLHFTGEPDLIEDLDAIPFPDFGLIDIKKYFSAWSSRHSHTSLTVSTMRGCPFSCRWCSKAVFGKSYRRRSPGSVVAELASLNKKYGPDRYWMVDDVFTIKKDWLREFSSLVKKNNLPVNYECITRADRMDRETIGLLRDSGCFRVWIGAESGSQEILDLMDRGVNVEEVKEMIKLSKEAGMETGTFLMLGYIGETEKNILQTLKHLKEADPDHYTLTIAYPIPGTGFYEDAEMAGLKVPGEWGCYTDREIGFNRHYSAAYYKNAIRYIDREMKAMRESKEGRMPGYVKNKVISLAARLMMYLCR